METYISRFSFSTEQIPKHLNFNKNFGDVILLNGVHQLITGFGIYDNQMWTEKVYKNGCELGAADYEMVDDALLITDAETRQWVLNAYKKAVSEHFLNFLTMHFHESVLNKYLGQFVF